MENRYYLAIDIGASSGRHILAHKKDGRIVLEEIYRFPNGMQEHNGHKVWNVDQLFGEIQTGMKKCADIGKIPYSMGIDTWAVDFVLLMIRDKELVMPWHIVMRERMGWTSRYMRLFRKMICMKLRVFKSRSLIRSIS